MSERFIPYGRQVIEDDDVAAVTAVLRGDWLTTGPVVGEFEAAFAEYSGVEHAVAVANGTAALHLCMLAADIGPGDEVIVPALTFAASANCVRYVGATVVFADVMSDTLTVDPADVERLIGPRTKAIVAVSYGGLCADMGALQDLANRHGLILVEDACHSPGAEYHGIRSGGLAHMSAFSLHPVKHMTTGEGGLVTTQDPGLGARLRRLRSHGIESDHRTREERGTWQYDMTELGFNYRLTDIQCALGLSQLKKLPRTLARRRELAQRYLTSLSRIDSLILPIEPSGYKHAWHLFAVRLRGDQPSQRREEMFHSLRAMGIGVNVHYRPVYQLSYYQELGYPEGLCPRAELAYAGLLSLPLWHGLTDRDQDHVIAALVRLL